MPEQETYWKIPFVWEEPQPRVEVPSRLSFQAANTLSHEALIAVVGQVMEASIDASDCKQVLAHGSHQATKQFLAGAKDGFAYQDDWWQIGLDGDGNLVGFVLPVIYPGYAKEGLEEASIYYIGVLPKYRGQHFGVDLLLQATRVLQDVGVWRIFCDTDAQNAAMIAAFKQVGYQQCGEPQQRPL